MFPGWNVSGLASRPGYPEIVVPIGFAPKPVPFSAAFVGAACNEPRLIEIAYAFEQATKKRVPPEATP